ncbi:ABC transporter permease, amino acid [Neisseria gonorrhoeae]|nr:ABC transporter permease, amino acid [Neisseria gonorrhoeae]
MDFRFDIIYEYRWMFLYGALTTLGLTVVATAGGSVWVCCWRWRA